MNGFKKIGEKIKFYREKRGITLETLARHTYISKNRLEEIENGQAIYQFWTLQKIAKALEIDLNKKTDREKSRSVFYLL